MTLAQRFQAQKYRGPKIYDLNVEQSDFGVVLCTGAWSSRCHLRFFSNLGHQTIQYLNLMDSLRGDKNFF